MRLNKILISVFFSILLIATIIALNAYGEWQDGSNDITITNGNSVNFEADVLTLDYSAVDIKMYNSNSDLIYIFPQYALYGQIYTVTSAIYGGPGNYEIVLSGDDGAGADSYTLDLTVDPIVVTNNPPTITSTPILTVNESSAYSYQMIVTDLDVGDIQTYSLNQGPTWLSVDSSTGLVSGTTPSVNYNVIYNIILGVSDGTDSDDQSYSLTVVDTTVIPPTDTNAPSVFITVPSNGLVYGSARTSLGYFISDTEGNLDSCWYSVDNGLTNHTMGCAVGVVSVVSMEGSNTWTVYANDTFGNKASDFITFTVDSSGPNVAITTPVNGNTYGSARTSLDYSISDAGGNLDSCWYSINSGLINQTMNCAAGSVAVNSVEGSNTWTVYANDTFGHSALDFVTFIVDTSGPVDTTSPNVEIMYPQQNIIYTNVTTMTYNVSDINLESCWYSVDSGLTNQTMNCTQGFVNILAVEGSNTWSIYAKDSYNNENSTDVTFVINSTFPDTTAPVITINSPENKKYRTSTIYFEITTDEFAVSVMSLDGGNNITMNDGSGLRFNYTLASVSKGSHTVVFYAEDGSGNKATASISFSVDTSKRSSGNNNDPSDVLEDDPEGSIYLGQTNVQPLTINLGEDDSKLQKEFILITIWESIVEFFKRLFGF